MKGQVLRLHKYFFILIFFLGCEKEEIRPPSFNPSLNCFYPISEVYLYDYVQFNDKIAGKVICEYDTLKRVVKEIFYDHIQFGNMIAGENIYIWMNDEVQVQKYDYIQFGDELAGEDIYITNN